MDSRPIGVMDSGLGGLTAIRELARILPREDIVYIGDTANLPYGAKTPEDIVRCTRAAVDFLLAQNVKTVVLVCGTATSAALQPLERECPVPISGVILPAVDAALRATRSRRIGVVATAATIASGAYEALIRERAPNVYTYGESYPLLVPLVEQGRFSADDRETSDVLDNYLTGVRQANVDTLILGCTHYPLLYSHFARLLPGVTLINPGYEAALVLADQLRTDDALNNGGGSIRFFVSGDEQNFARHASLLMQRDVTRDVSAATL